MKSVFFPVILIFLFPFLTNAGNIENQRIPLKVGVNKVSIVVVNTWNDDLVNLKFGLCTENIPEWLKIDDNSSIISIDKGRRSNSSIPLFLEVVNPPESATYEVPYSLTDEKGNSWYFSFKIYVNDGSQTQKPLENSLHDNYPNPFNPSTSIRYSLKENMKTKLLVYNTLGQTVRVLYDGYQNAGVHNVMWDSKDDKGNKVSSGIYFYKITAGNFSQTKRMMLVE